MVIPGHVDQAGGAVTPTWRQPMQQYTEQLCATRKYQSEWSRCWPTSDADGDSPTLLSFSGLTPVLSTVVYINISDDADGLI